MGRAIGGVVLGYVVMAVLLFATFTAAYLLMGANRAFQAGSYEVTAQWLVVTFVVSFLAAVIGGLVCTAVAKSSKAPLVLAGLVLVLGLGFALPVLLTEPPPTHERAGDVGNLEAMQNAREPGWVALLNPVIGVAGILGGCRVKKGLAKE